MTAVEIAGDRSRKTLRPPGACQAHGLDNKPEPETKVTPQDQVCALRRRFAICYSLLHTLLKFDWLFVWHVIRENLSAL